MKCGEHGLRHGLILPYLYESSDLLPYVSPDGSEEDGPRYELSAVPAPAWQRKQALTIASDIGR